MPKFRKKPVIINAIQFNGSSTHANQIKSWMNGQSEEPCCDGVHTRDVIYLPIETPEGCVRALPNDWIIKGINGEFYPCKPDIFAKTYEPIDSE